MIKWFLKRIKYYLKLYRRLLRVVGCITIFLALVLGVFMIELTRIDQVGLHTNFHLCPGLKFLDRLPKVLDVFYLPLTLKKTELPEYELEVDNKDLGKLFAKIPVCFNCNGPPTKKKISAKLIAEGKSYNVEIGLRGLCADHWMNEKKSWKINWS